MRRILILDDDENRHDFFRKIFRDCLRVHVYTTKQAIEELSDRPRFDLVCLDHDLPISEKLIGVINPGDGAQVAAFIRDFMLPLQYPKAILIHSQNQKGSERIREILKPTGIPVTVKPFNYR